MEKKRLKITLNTGNQSAEALVANRYAEAYAMLTIDVQRSWSPKKLESRYKKMIAYGGEPVKM